MRGVVVMQGTSGAKSDETEDRRGQRSRSGSSFQVVQTSSVRRRVRRSCKWRHRWPLAATRSIVGRQLQCGRIPDTARTWYVRRQVQTRKD